MRESDSNRRMKNEYNSVREYNKSDNDNKRKQRDDSQHYGVPQGS